MKIIYLLAFTFVLYSCGTKTDLEKICELLVEYEKAEQKGNKEEAQRLETEMDKLYAEMMKQAGRDSKKMMEIERNISGCENAAYEAVHGPK